MNEAQKLRYSRHILLPELGYQGQHMLMESTATVVGVGGLGSIAALYLAAAGVGELILVDHDRVELSNLQRQIIHSQADLGQLKVTSAKRRLESLNSEIKIDTFAHTVESLEHACLQSDVILDCTDNFPSRFAINRYCVESKTPLVSAAVVRLTAQITTFKPGGPCYRCLYADETAAADTCATRGVLGPLLGVMGSLQALEAIKLLTDIGTDLSGRVVSFDALNTQWKTTALPSDPTCPVCSKVGEDSFGDQRSIQT